MSDLLVILWGIVLNINTLVMFIAVGCYFISHRSDKYPELKYWTQVIFRSPLFIGKDVEIEVGYYTGYDGIKKWFDKYRNVEFTKEYSLIV